MNQYRQYRMENRKKMIKYHNDKVPFFAFFFFNQFQFENQNACERNIGTIRLV